MSLKPAVQETLQAMTAFFLCSEHLYAGGKGFSRQEG